MRALKRLALLALFALFLVPDATWGVITFTQLDDDTFVVSHRVKLIGSRGKAMKLANTKAASLCVAAGYSHYTILNETSEAAQEDDAANASVRVQYHFEDGDGRIDCQRNADPEYVNEAAAKLAKRGYQRPDAPTAGDAVPAAAPSVSSTCPGGCTIEQIATMARAGLTDEQIQAACSGD